MEFWKILWMSWIVWILCSNHGMAGRVLSGAEVFQRAGFSGLKPNTGVLTNPTAVFSDTLEHLVDVLHTEPSSRGKVIAVFGPEHGFRGDKQAGEDGENSIDPRTGLPVYDTYKKRGAALDQVFMESGVKSLIFDIQDVGVRFYTYIWSLWDALESCGRLGIDVIVLDRPNPLGGLRVDGPVLRRGFESGVGRLPIPLQHGMTIGELAIYFNEVWIGNPRNMEAFGLTPHSRKVQLKVIPIQGWERRMTFQDTGMVWIPPSPNVPTFETALVYPGFGMLEGTICSEGRGTTRPFETSGDVFLNEAEEVLAVEMNQLNLPGVIFREVFFTPTFSKYQGKLVRGTQAHITNYVTFDSIEAVLHWIIAAKRIGGPDGFAWRKDHFIDLLSGNEIIRTSIDRGMDVPEIRAQWTGELEDFLRIRSQYLLYK